MIRDSLKPKKCCDLGTYKCTIPMPIKGRVQYIDYCISDIVAALNAAHITTVASCCGHGIMPATILLEEDDKWLIITDREKALKFIEEHKK